MERATLEELKEFANKVREAGGGNPIDALMPAIPTDTSECLIAKNLNFNCTVGAVGGDDGSWWMAVDTEEIRDKIAKSLNLEKANYMYYPEYGGGGYEVYAVRLSDEIGQIASDFDEWDHAIIERFDPKLQEYRHVIRQDTSERCIQNLKDFWPYVDESIKESLDNADFVNDKGELII